MAWKQDIKQTTRDEVRFLQGLGTYKQSEEGLTRCVATPEERLTLLQGYQKSMDLRFTWKDIDVDIDPGQVAVVLEQEIAKTRAEIAAKKNSSVN